MLALTSIYSMADCKKHLPLGENQPKVLSVVILLNTITSLSTAEIFPVCVSCLS